MPRWAAPALALAIAAVGFGLRLHRLVDQPLWWDEGVSIYLAAQDLAQLTWAKDLEIDLHPPLHPALLLLWGKAAGLSVFAVRWFSVAFGTLCLPLAFALVRRWVGDGAALVATLLAAVSPILVYYSQEARMYGLVPALALGGLLAWDELRRRLDADRAPCAAGLAWVALTVLSLATYYYTAWLIWAEMALGLPGRRPWRRVVLWTRLGLLVAVLYLPWPLFLLRSEDDWWGNGVGQAPPHALDAFLDVTWRAFTVGFTVEPPLTDILAALALAVAVFGFALGPWRGRATRWLALGLAVLPVAASFLMLAFRDFYFPRLVLPVVFLALAFVGAGVRVFAGVQPGLALLVLATLLWGSAFSLGQQWFEQRTGFNRADYGVVLPTVRAAVRPGDAVLCSQAWQCGYLVADLTPTPLALRGAAPAWLARPGRLQREVDAFRAGRERLWVVTLDPTGAFRDLDLERAVSPHGPLALVDQSGDTRVALFGPPAGLDAAALGLAPLDADLGGVVRLLGYRLDPAAGVRPGDRLALTLAWRALAPVPRDYTVFNQLLGPDGAVAAQRDAPPLGNTLPTSRWRAGLTLVDRYTIPVPSDAPTGVGRLIVGLYDPLTGDRLPVTGGGDFVPVAEVRAGE